jgi:hypothetical protein
MLSKGVTAAEGRKYSTRVYFTVASNNKLSIIEYLLSSICGYIRGLSVSNISIEYRWRCCDEYQYRVSISSMYGDTVMSIYIEYQYKYVYMTMRSLWRQIFTLIHAVLFSWVLVDIGVSVTSWQFWFLFVLNLGFIIVHNRR